MDTTDHTAFSPRQIALNYWGDSLWFRLLLFLALGLGVFFRLGGLGHKIYSHDEAYTSLYAAGHLGNDVFTGIWNGEDTTVREIQKYLRPQEGKNIVDVLSLMALYRPHQAPLFFVLEHWWMQLAGYTPAAMRGLAAIFGLLTIPGVYWLGRELFRSPRIALLSAAFFALSPYQILFSQDARPYSLWTLMTITSSAVLLWALKRNSRGAWLLYSLTLILGMYSQQLFVLLIAVHGLYLIAVYGMRYSRGLAGFLSAGLLAFLAYIPWLFYVVTRWEHVARQVEVLNMRLPWHHYIQKWALIFSSPFIDLDFSSGNLVPYLLRAPLLLLLAIALFFLARYGPSRLKMFIVLIYIVTAGALILPDIVLGGIRSTSGRYFVPANIATILVMAYFLMSSLDQARPETSLKWKFLITSLMAVSIFSNVNSLLAETWWTKELGRVQPSFISEINKNQTVLIVSGGHPTNLGDVLLLGLEVDADVHFLLYEDLQELVYPQNYQNVYWFPSSHQEVEKISNKKGFLVREVINGTLWRIDGIKE